MLISNSFVCACCLHNHDAKCIVINLPLGLCYVKCIVYCRLNSGGLPTNWLDEAVQPATFDTSPGGFLITESEYVEIMSYPRPKFVTPEMTTTLLRRLNNTFYSWDQGFYHLPTNGTVYSRNQSFNHYTDNNTIDCNAFISSINTLSRGFARAEEV